MKKRKRGVKIILIIITMLIVMLSAIYINHQIHLKKESALLSPLGQIVEVDGHKTRYVIR